MSCHHKNSIFPKYFLYTNAIYPENESMGHQEISPSNTQRRLCHSIKNGRNLGQKNWIPAIQSPFSDPLFIYLVLEQIYVSCNVCMCTMSIFFYYPKNLVPQLPLFSQRNIWLQFLSIPTTEMQNLSGLQRHPYIA